MWYVILIGLLIYALIVLFFLDVENAELRSKKLTLEMENNELEQDLVFIKKKKDLYFYKLVEIEKAVKKQQSLEEIDQILKRPKIN